jgi:hypothetical protein
VRARAVLVHQRFGGGAALLRQLNDTVDISGG